MIFSQYVDAIAVSTWSMQVWRYILITPFLGKPSFGPRRPLILPLALHITVRFACVTCLFQQLFRPSHHGIREGKR